MTISDFWHRAFITALSRVPAEEAKKEADLATEIAVDHWDQTKKNFGQVVRVWASYADLDITDMRRPGTQQR